jgi:hypothetical protein
MNIIKLTKTIFKPVLFAFVCLFTPHSKVAAQIKTELAGHSLISYPFFEYVKAINVNRSIQVAIDPTRFTVPVTSCRIYVVVAKGTIGWNTNNTLTDVTLGGFMTVNFTGGNIQGNTFTVVAANELSANAGLGLGVGYDVVLDFNNNGLLDAPDFIDGRNNESGFYRVHNTSAAGPEAVTILNYNISAATAATYGIPAGFEPERLYFPTNVVGVKAATGKNLPLIIVSHGNGHQYTWYDHIGNHLASYGYVVMSHRNNTVPGTITASTTTLAHTDALIDRINANAIVGASALTGNIDADRIVWIGHSRGAEGVVIAYDRMFDGTYTPVNYTMPDIKLISSMLPTDFQGTNTANPHNANYHLWTASGDDDVSGGATCPASTLQLCRTFHLHGRAVGNRQSTVVQGVGHGWFHNGGGNPWITGPCQLDQAKTNSIVLGHLLPLVKRYVEDNIPSLDFLTRQYESFRPIGVSTTDPCIVVSHEYIDASSNTAANPQKTVMIDDYQTQTTLGMSSIGASVTFSVQNVLEGLLNDVNSDFTWTAADPFNGATQGGSTDFLTTRSDDSRGIVFDWDNTLNSRYYEWEIPLSERNFNDNLFLSFRGAQATQHPNNAAIVGDLTFKVTLRDGQGTPVSSSISIGSFGGGLEKSYQRSGGWHNEMETIRIRLTDFLNNGSGLDLTNVVAIRLDVGSLHGSASGRVVIDELMLTNDRAVYDAGDNGDPHIRTVNGVNYDFHGAGEYTLLQDGSDYEIQVRQTPVTTANPLYNGYTGLSSCVAVNTALAARVGSYRISYQPSDPQEFQTTMQLRVNGALTDINALGTVNLGVGGRVAKAAIGDGIQVDFPNGSSLLVTPGWWSTHNINYLNISVLNTPATEGLAGFIQSGQWLPALRNGTNLGSLPSSLTSRYKQLNVTFSNSWRITNATSLFDYAPGTSTTTFVIKDWPVENAINCKLSSMPAVEPIPILQAEKVCSEVKDPVNRKNCIVDVMATGDEGFAKTLIQAEILELNGTKTEVFPEEKTTKSNTKAVFIAVVKRNVTAEQLFAVEAAAPSIGRVQFYLNDKPMDEPVPVDNFGKARWTSPILNAGQVYIRAEFIPAAGNTTNLPSRSMDLIHRVL